MGNFKGVTPRLLPLFIHPDRLEEALLVGAVREMCARVGKDAFLGQQKAIMGRADSGPGLADIDVPTLVICGRDDELTPLALSEEIAEGIPGARLVPVEACAHLSTLEQPEAVTALLRYWIQV